MPEVLIRPEGRDELTGAVEAALAAWFDDVEVTTARTAAGVQIMAAVRWPAAGVWRRLVDEHVIPVSERLYRAGAAVVDGTALERFLDGVRDRLVEQSTLIDDIKAAQQQYGDEAASIDWQGADGDAAPWRSRTALIGDHESQVTSMQAATDSHTGARKRWRSRDDARTRATHRAADGQAVPLDSPFRVGGAELQYPGDPSGPAGEVLNCRCEMYLITTEESAAVTASLTAAVTVDTDLPWAPRDTEWDGPANRTALLAWATGDDDEVDEEALARAFVWRTDGPPSDWKLPVARVSDGNLELVWNGVTAAAAAAQGARSPLDLPAADVDKVRSALGTLYAKAADEFDDDSITPPWDRETEASLAISAILRGLPHDASPRSVVASLDGVVETIEQGLKSAARRQLMASALSSAIDDAQQATTEGDDGGPWRPPAGWFAPPDGSQTELISPEGRVAGYVATWEDVDGAPMCHAGYAAEGECQTVPRGGDYGYFHQGNVTLELDDGSKVHPGLLTTDIGHGPATQFVDQQVAHYDNPQAIAAAVVVGEDDKGIWMSGAVLPQVMKDPDKFTRLQLTPVSGHWSETQPGGPLELIAVTSVNKPGYPQRSTSGYQLAASIAGSQVSDLTMFRAQLAEMLATVDTILEGGTSDEGPEAVDEPPLEDMPASAAPGGEPAADEAPPMPSGPFPEGVDRELVLAALKVLPEMQKLPQKDLTAAALPGIKLPACLQILSDFLEGEGTETHHSRAAAVKGAEAICRSADIKNAAVRARACRLVSEYRVKAGKR